MLIITALLVSTLLPGGGGRGTGSRSEFWNVVNMVRGGQKCWSTAAYTSNCCPKATHYSVVSACDVILHELKLYGVVTQLCNLNLESRSEYWNSVKW